MLLNLIFTDKQYINEIIKNNFNKAIEKILIYQNLIEIYVIFVIKK